MRLPISARFFCIAGALLLACPFPSSGEQQPEAVAAPKARPRVGLVLSGGGARGIAHIGVLRVLEERHVPVDLITGTSMGSIIGGLYAAGYSPDQMEKIVDDIDWADAFDDAPARAERSFRRKEDDLNFLTSLKLGVKDGGIALPWGLVQGQKLNLILRRLFLPVADVYDFDQLHVPFRVVSTDVVTGKAEVHASGDLATAVRASMSMPGIFAPVEYGEKLLVDGGISNNTPVDLALGMGADVVIVVDVGTPLDPREKITNAAVVVGQLISLMVVSTTERQLALMRPHDILIRPDLEGVSTGSFDLGSKVAPRGEAAARAKLSELDRLSISEANHAVLLARQRHGEYAPPMIDVVRIANDSELRDDVLQARLETRAGEPLDVARLEADVEEVYGIDAFQRVDYALKREPDGLLLEIDAREKSWGPQYLRFGLNLSENFENSSDYNLAFNYTVQPFNGLGAEWRNDIQIGSTQRLLTEFWQPLDAKSRWFVAPSFEFRRERFPVYNGDERTGEFLVRQTNFGVDLGRQLSNWGEARIGLIYDVGHARTVIGTAVDPDHFRSGGLYARLAADTLDNVHFPNHGNLSRLAFGLVRESLGADNDYELVRGRIAQAFTFRKNSVLLSVAGQTAWGASDAVADIAHMGGFLNLSGLDRYQLAGKHSIQGKIVTYRRIAVPGALPLSYPIYAGLSFETGNVSQVRNDLFDDLILAGSAFLGMETPLGPLYFGYGYAEGNRDSFYLFLGRPF